MKRNLDLIYDILVRVEDQDGQYSPEADVTHEKWSAREIRYHVVLCVEAGLVVASEHHDSESRVVINRLTWRGHDLLDEMRRERGGSPVSLEELGLKLDPPGE